jgi:hypothetical protein
VRAAWLDDHRPLRRPGPLRVEVRHPLYVYDEAAARERYVLWAREGYGRGLDPADQLLRYYVGMIWQPRCLKPLYLAHVGALLDAEVQLLAGDRWARSGRPGRCRSQMLDQAAEEVPGWLACCRQEPRRGTS